MPLVRIVLVTALLMAARRILADGARGLGLPGLGTLAEIVSLVVLAARDGGLSAALGARAWLSPWWSRAS